MTQDGHQVTNQQRYECGLGVLKEMVNDNMIQAIQDIESVFPDFGRLIVSFGFGDLYARPTLDLMQRELITLTSLITQGATEQLPFHVHAALNVGLKPEEILELVMHCAGYVGFPKAISALQVVTNIMKERNINLPCEEK